MIDSCKHHVHCDRLPNPRRGQTTLAIIDGFLSLSLDPPPVSTQRRRTSAGKSIRNIANTPTFSTTDSSLTSFLRFPPEVRLQIYGYLLISHQTIRYGICPIKWRLVEREQCWQPWIRHGIFPSILQCCERINAEGSAVLYGKNAFEIEQYMRSSTCAIVGTWAPSRANMLSITRLILTYSPCCDCSQDPRTLEIMDLFPALKEVKIWLQDPKAEEWIKFLEVASGTLQQIKKVVLMIGVAGFVGQELCRKWSGSLITDEDKCLRAFQGPFLKQQELWHNRKVRWEFEQEMDSFARCHGVLGNLNIVME